MHIYTHLAIIVLLCLTGIAHGQEPASKPAKKIVIREFWVHTGFFSSPRDNGSIEDFRVLAPGSALLYEPMEGHMATYSFGGAGHKAFSAMVGLQFGDGSGGIRSNPLLRVGISYNNGAAMRTGMYRRDRITFDTLTSGHSGQVVYLDSLVSSNYHMGYTSEQILLDASLLFRTRPAARWSFYAGIGLAGGISINAWTEISHSEWASVHTRRPNGNSSYYSSEGHYFSRRERYRMKNNATAFAYLPMGVNLRVGKNSEFLRRLHLFMEMRPGISMTSLPELRTVSFTRSYIGLGLRVVWD